LAGRILAGLAMMLVSLIPVVLMAALVTMATVTPLAFLAATEVTALASIPFTLIGLTIGYALPQKAATAVGDFPFDGRAVVSLIGWTITLGALSIWAYRRDEGRRFS
jgi:ABC-2 type transport system permease protein